MANDGTLIKVREPMLYFDNVSISSEEDVKILSNKINDDIKTVKGKLLSLAMATPKDISGPDYNNPMEFVEERVEEYFNDLYDLFYDYYTVGKIGDIIDSWKYSWNDNPRDIYENCNTVEELRDNVFPEDKHEKIKHDMTHFSFAPDDDTILDTLARSIRNIKLNGGVSDFISNKYVIIENERIYSEFDGRFLFKSEEDAKKILDDKFDLHILDYISREFINKHPDFYPSIIENMRKNNVDKKTIDEFSNVVDKFINGDGKYNQEIMDPIYDIMKSFIKDTLYKMCNIKIVRFRDLIK